MKYTLGEKKNGKITVDFVIPEKEWEEQIENAYKKNCGKYKVEGFRQGKAPRKLLEKSFGEYLFWEDALNDMIPEVYSKMLAKEKELFPVDYPQVDVKKFAKDGVEFTATITLLPELTLGEYKGLEVTKGKVKVTDAMVEDEIAALRNKQMRYIDVVGRPAQMGDVTTINYAGSIDGVAFAGGTAEKQELELGSHTFIPGFEEGVVGMNIGDEKDIEVTFPAEYHAADLAGKPAIFKVKLVELHEKQLPEVNDEFAKNVSEFNTLAELKADIKKKLTETQEKSVEQEAENKLIEKIAKASKVDIPECMVEAQIDKYVKDMEQRLAYQGLKLDDFLKYTGKTMEDLRKERHDDALKAIRTTMTLEAIIKAEKLEVTKEEFNAKLEEIAKGMNKKVSELKKTMRPEQEDFVNNTIIGEKVINYLKSNNTIK